MALLSPDEIFYSRITPNEDSLCEIETPVACPEESCKKVFISKSVLKLHFTQTHLHAKMIPNPKQSKDIIENFHCPVKECIYHETGDGQKKFFAKYKYLKQHYLKVHAICKFICDHCHKKFPTQSLLNAHLRYCDLHLSCSCGSKFSSIESILTHTRRTAHKADVLSVYYQRMKKKKLMKSSLSRATAYNKMIANTPSSSTIDILPKPQSRHIIAALALSELAVGGLHRLPSVDVGVQTEFIQTKRISRKCSVSPSRNKEHLIKRKQTTEMETQTRLTNLKNKKRKCSSRNIAKCSIGLTADTNSFWSAKRSHKNQLGLSLNDTQSEVLNVCSDVTYQPQYAYSETQTVNYVQVAGNFDNSYSLTFSTSGTQTSPRISLSASIIPHSSIDNIPYNLFENENNVIECMISQKTNKPVLSCSSRIINGVPNVDQILPRDEDIEAKNLEKNNSLAVNSAISENSLCSDYGPSQLMIDEDEHFSSLSNSNQFPHVTSHSKRLSFSQIRSSSIETQTDHDVFLSTHVQTPDDADDIILTSTETQTDQDTSSLWCTSETQTCEEFSDIEQFLCSTIHTQTQNENDSNELFPELNFTAESQTQTGLDESPVLINTHTQTSVLGLSLLKREF